MRKRDTHVPVLVYRRCLMSGMCSPHDTTITNRWSAFLIALTSLTVKEIVQNSASDYINDRYLCAVCKDEYRTDVVETLLMSIILQSVYNPTLSPDKDISFVPFCKTLDYILFFTSNGNV